MKAGRCRHYRGVLGPGLIEITACEAGIVFEQQAGGRRDFFNHLLPCVGDGRPDVCPTYSPYTDEEERASLERARARLSRQFEEKICPACDQQWAGRQVGRCVYCDHCGHRLYQGALPKAQVSQ